MTGGSIREYTEAVRGRYLRASKKEKGRILDEFTKVIGCHRKVAIRLLRRENQSKGNKQKAWASPAIWRYSGWCTKNDMGSH